MMTHAGNRLYVEFSRIPPTGSTWVVRVYRKLFFFRKLESSDWFLDELQAQKFAEELAGHLRGRGSVDAIRKRTPGWTLQHPPH